MTPAARHPARIIQCAVTKRRYRPRSTSSSYDALLPVFIVVVCIRRPPSSYQGEGAIRLQAAAGELRQDRVGMSKTRDDQVIVSHRANGFGGELIRRADRQMEEASGATVVDDADQRQIRRLQAHVGDLRHVAGSIENDTLLSVAVRTTAARNLREAAANLLARLRVEMNGVLERLPRCRGERFPASRRHQIPDMARAGLGDLHVA